MAKRIKKKRNTENDTLIARWRKDSHRYPKFIDWMNKVYNKQEKKDARLEKGYCRSGTEETSGT